MNTDKIIEYTNNKISKWYDNALIDFNIVGSGICALVSHHKEMGTAIFKIEWKESGEKNNTKFLHNKSMEIMTTDDEGVEFIYDIWAAIYG